MEKQNTCENCRYFSHHYAKDNTNYHKVFCGHCLNNEVIKDKRKKGCDGVCDKWKTIAIRKEERKDALLTMKIYVISEMQAD